jgi:hypothetical protein
MISNLYSCRSCRRYGELFLIGGIHKVECTRVPATINEAKGLLDADVEMEPCQDKRYSYHVTTSS